MSAIVACTVAALAGIEKNRNGYDVNPCNFVGVDLACAADENGKIHFLISNGSGENAKSDGVVLIDFGGPGLTIDSQALTLADVARLMPPDLKNRTLVVAVEPWGRVLTDGCHEATQRHMRAARDLSPGDVGSDWTDACRSEMSAIAEWKEGFADRISSVAKALNYGGDEFDFIGWSWASRTLFELKAAETRVRNWVLLAPVEPIGDLTQVMSHRSERVVSAFDAISRDWCSGTLERHCTFGDIVRQSGVAAAEGVVISERSVSFGTLDLGAAIYGASYEPEFNSEWLSADLNRIVRGETQEPVTMGRVADQVQQRYGVADYSEAMSGYLLGVCAAMGNQELFRYSSYSGDNPVLHFLSSLHPCGPPSSNDITSEQRSSDYGGNGCVVLGEFDPISVPIEESRNYWNTEVTMVSHVGHSLSLRNPEVSRVLTSVMSGDGCA